MTESKQNPLGLKKGYKNNNSPDRNINLVYSKLAKQLKMNKTSFDNISKGEFDFSGTKGEDNVNQSEEQMMNIMNKMGNMNMSKSNNVHNSVSITNKNTKENTGFSGTNSATMSMNMNSININRVEGPEELHLFHVSLVQKSKSLACKFDNVSDECNNIN